MTTKKSTTAKVEVVQLTTTGDFMLIVTRAGWFSAVVITEAEAEKTARNMEIEIQKRTVLQNNTIGK